VIGISGLIGLVVVALLAMFWPSEREVAAAVAEPA
jgi:hypothetical protein